MGFRLFQTSVLHQFFQLKQSPPSTAEVLKNNIKVSPDGKKFFFVTDLNPAAQNSLDALYSCNADGTGVTKIADNIDEFSDAQ